MIHTPAKHPNLNAEDVVRVARQRLTASQGACSATNPELLKASIEGLLAEIETTAQLREQIHQELGIPGGKQA